MKRIAAPTPAGPRSWAHLWLEVVAKDHPMVWGFLLLIGFSAGAMFSVIMGIGTVVTLHEAAFGGPTRAEGPLFPVAMAASFASSLGVTWLSLKGMEMTNEVEGGPPVSVESIKWTEATPPNLFDRDLDEAI